MHSQSPRTNIGSCTFMDTVYCQSCVILCLTADEPFLLHDDKYRGLAILVTCDYEGTNNQALNATNEDANEMRKTFKQLQYNVHQLKNGNATERKITILLNQASRYLSLYSGKPRNSDGSPKVIVLAFSGHGTSCGWDDDRIVSNNGKFLLLKKDVVPRLVRHEAVATIPKLFFIDACRGSAQFLSKRLEKGSGIGIPSMLKMVKNGKECGATNYRIDYATIPNYTSAAGPYQSTWMPVLARFLREKDRELSVVVEEVKGEIAQGTTSQQPQSVNSLGGLITPLKLYYRCK